jgi:ankyrin repeat protein
MRFISARPGARFAAAVGCLVALIPLCPPATAASRVELDRQLLEAAERADAVRCRELTRSGASVYARDAAGRTPLAVVCTCDSPAEPQNAPRSEARLETARVLLEARSDPNVRNRDGGTALMGAAGARGCGPELIRLLLRSGAKVNLADRLDQTALMFASGAYGDPESVHLLLDVGADLRAEDWEGRTALWRATSSRRPEIVVVLLKAGARE